MNSDQRNWMRWLGLGGGGLLLGLVMWAAWPVESSTQPVGSPERQGAGPLAGAPVRAKVGQAGRTSVRDFGARGNGEADDAEAIQQAVDASPGELYFPPGTYRLGKPIVVELDKVGPLSILGSSAARVVMAGAGPAFRFVGTHQGTADPSTVQPPVWQRQRMPTVEGLEIVGEHAESGGLEAEGTMKLTVRRLLIRNVQHGIHLVRRNRNVLISECHIYDNRGIGVSLEEVDLHQINIFGCHISYNRGGGIVTRAGNVRNLQVAGCDIEANGVNIFIDASGSKYGTAEVAITGCTIQHGGGEDSANIRIFGAGEKYHWGHVCITGNVLSDVDMNLHLRQTEDVVVSGNTFWMAYKYNLLAENCSRLVVGANAFGRNPGYDYVKVSLPNALRLVGCRDVALQGFVVHEVRQAEAGLVLEDCERVNLTGCTFVDCSGPGVLLKNVSRSRVSDCLVDHGRPVPHWVAIQVQGGHDNLLTGNLLGGTLEMEPTCGQATGNLECPVRSGPEREKPAATPAPVPEKPAR